MQKLLLVYISVCSRSKVKACVVNTETDHVLKGIVEKSSSASKRRLEKVVKSSQAGTSHSLSDKSSNLLGFGKRELKQIEADDQAIQTILLGLPEDIYAVVDSCETAQEIWLRVQQMLKGSDIGIQEKNAKLFNEWERQMQMVGGNGGNQFRQYAWQNAGNLNGYNAVQNVGNQVAQNPRVQNDGNQNQIGNGNLVAVRAEGNAAGHNGNQIRSADLDEIEEVNANCILMANLQQASSSGLMAKAFKLNYSTPTNNNQRISSNPRNMQIAQPGMNMGQDRQMQTVRGYGENQSRQYAGQNAGNLNGYNAIQNVRNQVAQNPRVQNVGNQNGLISIQGNGNQNQIGNGNLVAVRAERNAAGHNGNQIRCYNCRGKEEAGIQLQTEEYDLMAAAADLDEIEEVNANCI
nr:zinc finger, RING/FYVE/PHD-type [Tanacetum cinerariifolium]